MSDERTETYTPGHSPNAVQFMARRSATSHAAFLLPHLRPGLRLLDIGPGPGTITLDLAALVAPGPVVGIDRADSQVHQARQAAADRGMVNVEFAVGSVYGLGFADGSFDVVFAHAVFEHLSRPLDALAELRRVVAPGGLVALRSPDWGGFLINPETREVRAAIAAYEGLQTRNGGNPHVGRTLRSLARQAGLTDVRFSASYEIYDGQPAVIAEFLALKLESVGDTASANALRHWAGDPEALFAQSWCEVLAKK
ncbi:MAG: methyltransferase domain-containing protein [Gemmataceae bacterium]